MASQQFFGPALSAADGKGRFVLPVAMRALAKSKSGDANKFCISVHDRYRCGIGFGTSRLDELAAEIDREETVAIQRGEPYDRDAAHRAKFGRTEEISFDDGGRFTLPTYVRKRCQIEDLVYFYGAGRHFELWNPAVLIATDGIDPIDKEMAQDALDEWAANPKNKGARA